MAKNESTGGDIAMGESENNASDGSTRPFVDTLMLILIEEDRGIELVVSFVDLDIFFITIKNKSQRNFLAHRNYCRKRVTRTKDAIATLKHTLYPTYGLTF